MRVILLVLAAACATTTTSPVERGYPRTSPATEDPRARAESLERAERQRIEADPARWAGAVSGRVCAAEARRELAHRGIAKEQEYADKGGGVVDLTTIHNWQLELRAADDGEAAARAALAAHGMQQTKCTEGDARTVELCMLLPSGYVGDPDGTCNTPAARAAVDVAVLSR